MSKVQSVHRRVRGTMLHRARGFGLIGVSLAIVSGFAVLTGSLVTFRNMTASTTAHAVYLSSFNIQHQIRNATRTGDSLALPGDWREDHFRINPVMYDEGDLSIYKLSVRAYVDDRDHDNVMLVFERAPLDSCQSMAQRIGRASSQNFITGCGIDGGQEVMFVGFWGDERGRLAFSPSPAAGSGPSETEATPESPPVDDQGADDAGESEPVPVAPVAEAPAPDAPTDAGGEYVMRNDCWQPFISCSGLGDGSNPGQGSHNNNSQGQGGSGVSNPNNSGGGGNGNGGN